MWSGAITRPRSSQTQPSAVSSREPRSADSIVRARTSGSAPDKRRNGRQRAGASKRKGIVEPTSWKPIQSRRIAGRWCATCCLTAPESLRVRNMPKHHVTVQFAREINVSNTDVDITVRSDDKLLGRVQISTGSIDWFPSPNKKVRYELSWERFADLMLEHGTEKKR
jgi:hypothetical protein